MARAQVPDPRTKEELAQEAEFVKIRLQQQKDSPNLPDPVEVIESVKPVEEVKPKPIKAK